MIRFFSISSMLFVGLLGLAYYSSVADASDEHTRNMYTVRSPGDAQQRRAAMEMIDLGTFLLTNSEDGRPKSMTPFYLNILETQNELSDAALINVADATSDFLLLELNSIFGAQKSVASVMTHIAAQKQIEKQVDTNRKLKSTRVRRGQRSLRAVKGSEFQMHVNVTFDREPSPGTLEVDRALKSAMKDLTHLVTNLTATEDPELEGVFMAYREEMDVVEGGGEEEGNTSPSPTEATLVPNNGTDSSETTSNGDTDTSLATDTPSTSNGGDEASEGSDISHGEDDSNGEDAGTGEGNDSHGESDASGGSAGDSTSEGSAGESTSEGSAGDSTSEGSAGDSTSGGSAGDNTSEGTAGDSTSGGSAGDSTSEGSAGESTSEGSAGDSTSEGSAGDSTSEGNSDASSGSDTTEEGNNSSQENNSSGSDESKPSSEPSTETDEGPSAENPSNAETSTGNIDGISRQPDQTNEDGDSMKFIIPVVVAFVLVAAILALYCIRRRRRRVQATNQKVQEDLAFLDEESNVFSYENSPTKSTRNKRGITTAGSLGGSSSRDQSSVGPTSPSYGMIGLGSTSGASTVKMSNAQAMSLPSKLGENASTSLFAFSEEEDEDDLSFSGNSAKTPTSLQQSVGSNASSFNRLMNGEEGVSPEDFSPRHSALSPASTTHTSESLSDEQQYSSKGTIASFLSSHFFGGGDSVSQFAGSALTVPVSNTTNAAQQKLAASDDENVTESDVGSAFPNMASQKIAAKKGRSFSLSPRKNMPLSPSEASVRSRAKSETAAGEDDDSVFDFLASPNTTRKPVSIGKDNKNVDMVSLDEALEDIPELGAATSSSTHSDPHREETITDKARAHYDEENDASMDDSLSFSDAPGSFPRNSRRHARSTTQDGTAAYQTNAMEPQDWSMTDGMSDEDTLSERGGGAYGAFPKSGFRSPKTCKKTGSIKSPSNQSKSTISEAQSLTSKDDASQASASRQLINDLVWLSKKIAGVKKSAVEGAPGENAATGSALGAPPMIEPVDSLSYASQDGLITPSTHTSRPTGTPTSTGKASTPSNACSNKSVVCRDYFAPPGKLNIVIHSTKDGPAVHEVKNGSCLEGKIYPGDLIISVDDTDTRAYTAAQLMKMMADKSSKERKITVLHSEETTLPANT